jgi:uncharacterized membrane protein
MGIAAIFIRLVSIIVTQTTGGINWFDVHSDLTLLLAVIEGGTLQFASLVLWGAVVFILLYFITVIPALRSGKLTLVIPLEMTVSFILPVIVGFFVFAEPPNPYLIVGICACFAGILLLSKVQAELETGITKAPAVPEAEPAPEAEPEAVN